MSTQIQVLNNANAAPALSGNVNAGAVTIEAQRAITEAQSKIQLAKMFPRNETEAFNKLIFSCSHTAIKEGSSINEFFIEDEPKNPMAEKLEKAVVGNQEAPKKERKPRKETVKADPEPQPESQQEDVAEDGQKPDQPTEDGQNSADDDNRVF